jgi:membrane protein DedA with SNARE-associated domain
MPGETVLVAAAVFAGHRQEGSIAAIIAFAASGATVGDHLAFWTRRLFGLGLSIRHGPRFGFDEDRLKVGQFLFLRFGAIVFFGRFVAILRAFAAILAGANKLAPARLFFYNVAGGIVMATMFGLGGSALGAEFNRIAGLVGLAGLLLAFGLIFAAWRRYRRHEQELIEAAKAALSGPLGLSDPAGGDL